MVQLVGHFLSYYYVYLSNINEKFKKSSKVDGHIYIKMYQAVRHMYRLRLELVGAQCLY